MDHRKLTTSGNNEDCLIARTSELSILNYPFPDPVLNKLSGLFYGWRMVTLFILSRVFYSLLGKSWARPQLS